MTLGPDWRKATASHTSGCVEVAFDHRPASLNNPHVLVRNSRDPHGPVLTFTAHEWRLFCEGVAVGEFDLPAEVGPLPDGGPVNPRPCTWPDGGRVEQVIP